MDNEFKDSLNMLGWSLLSTTALDGNMSLVQAVTEEEHRKTLGNIEKVLEVNEVAAKPRILLMPSHTNGVVEITKGQRMVFEKVSKSADFDNEFVVNADAFVTNIHDYLFTLKPADCAAVFITSYTSKFVCFAHIGIYNIFLDTIPAIMNSLNVYGDNWTAFIFRHIHKDSYVYTGKTIFELASLVNYTEYLERLAEGKYAVDLTAAIKDQLEDNGVDTIIIDNEDNYKLALESKSFSHSAFANGKQKKDYRFMIGVWKE